MTGSLASGGVTIVGLGGNVLVPTFNLSGFATDGSDVGIPVTADFVTAAMQVKKPGDGDLIFGILMSYENDPQTGLIRGAVALTGGFRLTYKSGDTVAKGDSVVCYTNGQVKTTMTPNRTTVVDKNTTNQTVDVLLGF